VSFWIVVRVGKETRCTPCRSFGLRIVAVVSCQDWHIDGATLWNIYTGLKDTRYPMAGAVTPERPTAYPGSARTRRWFSPGVLPARPGADEALRASRFPHPQLLR